jgi:hypothetical protein
MKLDKFTIKIWIRLDKKDYAESLW